MGGLQASNSPAHGAAVNHSDVVRSGRPVDWQRPVGAEWQDLDCPLMQKST